MSTVANNAVDLNQVAVPAAEEPVRQHPPERPAPREEPEPHRDTVEISPEARRRAPQVEPPDEVQATPGHMVDTLA